MSDFLDRIGKLSPQRLALLALEQHEQLEAAAQRRREPIAVIGIGCRFPGDAHDPQAFWRLLREGRDAIVDVPPERWDIEAWFDADPDAPARMSVRNGGFLSDVGHFDPAFFGIAPREALTMDPQQRLLLEVTWEALEHAGIAADRLAGSDTGVYVGVCNSDHFQRLIQRGPDAIDAYIASGNAHSVAAGRIAYCLGLQGPALAIDTACSSSLVALHVACRSLRQGESRMALAAGVNVMCSPETTVTLTKAHMLAPDGRCKTFDAGADGFARGEGCGVLVLKRLSDARADGDRILALVRGTASNQDGRSGGLTVPNGPAQEAVIRGALADAGLQPADIDYVEAHGTGTTLGDPIEVRALAGALGPGRAADRPLLIGSVKTNIGHLESAAGVAGVIKVILALQEQRIPPHIHFRTPSPHIAWQDYPVEVTAQGRDWPRGERPRRAGVSSFGFSGTNAHVVLEEAPPVTAPTHTARPWHCLPLSARSAAALAELAARHAAALARTGMGVAAVAHTAAVGRSQFDERLAVVAAQTDEACAALDAAARGDSHPALLRGTAVPGEVPEVVFLFTGQGSQYPGMGAQLYREAPVFRAVIDRCDAILGPDAQGRTLRSVLQAGPADGAAIHETAWTQPALFAVEYGLAELWKSWGIVPAAVIGHSVGEYVAACVAGVFTLDEGLKLIAARGRLMQALPPGGTMAAVFASADEVGRAIAPMGERIAIAAINAVDSVVVSGDVDAVEHLLADLAQRDIQGQRLFISLAAHSPRVVPALGAMQALAEGVTMRRPRIPVAWNLGGGPLPAEASDDGLTPNASYWRRHLREPVRFADGMAWLHREGYRCFLEVGPHPTLLALAQRSLPEEGACWLHSLRRDKDDWRELMTSLGGLHVRGATIDWVGVGSPQPPPRVTLPTYPFERRLYWVTPEPPGLPRRRPVSPPAASALLGERLPVAVPVFECRLTPDAPAYLGEHRVQGAALVAGPVFLEMAQAAFAACRGPAVRAVEQFEIRDPLVLPDGGRCVQVQFTDEGPDATRFAVHSRVPDAADGDPWQLHATGRLSTVVPETDASPQTPPGAALGPEADCGPHYQRLAELGIALGIPFRSLHSARVGTGEVLAELRLPAGAERDAVAWAHPGLLDGALQAVGLALPVSADGSDIYLLTAVERLVLDGPLPARLHAHVRLRAAATPLPAEWRADVDLHGPAGERLGRLQGVVLRRASREALQRLAPAAEASLHYRVDWEAAPLAPRAALAPPAAYLPSLCERFAQLGLQHGVSVYDALLPELDRLSAAHTGQALRELGFDATPGRRFEPAAEAARLGVLSRHARLFARLLQMLAEDGVLRAGEGGYDVVGPLPAADHVARYDALLARFGDVDGELRTLRRCGTELARVLDGRQDPLQLLFPDGSFAEARKLYVESPYARTYNTALAEALQQATAGRAAGSRLRILEVGAGTGGTTSYVLPRLPQEGVEYTFTDLSPLFLERAAEQFGAYPFVRHALLDIERDPQAQGFEAGRYDVVIAANVLHATADLGATLRHVRELLAPGGLLLLLEGVAPSRWVDLSFGLTEGWWRHADTDLRPSYPLISRDAWTALLGSLGFEDAAVLPREAGDAQGQALLLARAPRRARRWTLVGGDDATASALAGRLEARGDLVRRESPEAGTWPAGDEWVYLDALRMPADDLAHAEAMAASQAVGSPLRGLAELVRRPEAGRAWLLTCGAQTLRGEAAEGARWQLPLWGVGRVFALEHPARWGGLIDLPPGGGADARAGTLLAAIDGDDGEDQTAWRDGARHAARLRAVPAPAAAPLRLRTDATYLVTGGFGGLGLLVARWLAEHGAGHIALLGRRPDAGLPALREIEALGSRIHVLQADVADEAGLTAQLQHLQTLAPPLRGVLHAAADLNQAPIATLTPAQIEAMLRPKLAGTLALERSTRSLELDFMVLFSSTTALLGASGLAHYAAANLFLDATALAARRRGRPLLSVNWGTWEAMRLASAQSQLGFREAGLEPMRAAEALDALTRLLGSGAAQGVVARIDWQVLKPVHEARRPRPFLRHLGGDERPAASAPPREAAVAASALAQRFAAAPTGLRQDLLIDYVQQEVAQVLALQDHDTIPLGTGLFDLGMDSLMAVELKRRLERGIGHALPSTLTFNYPNVGALARFFEAELAARLAATAPPVPVAVAAEVRAATDERALDELSDDELEARLLARLEQIG